MSEHPRKHHGQSTGVREDRFSDDRRYRATHDEYDHDPRFASESGVIEHLYITRDDRSAEHQHIDHTVSHAASDYDNSMGADRIEPDFPETEEVWLKEKLSRITYNDNDLRDIQPVKHSTMLRTMAGVAGIGGILVLIGFLAVSSAPDLSPEEIIAMEGYGGEQQVKTSFNLASLRDCDASADCDYTTKTTIIPVTSTSTSALVSNTNDIEAETVRNITESVNEVNTQIREIPAAQITANTSTGSTGNTLVVLQQWSNVRGRPDINGEILTSLAEGTNVTKIGQTGQWLEVEVNGRKRVTGYMHRSTVTTR